MCQPRSRVSEIGNEHHCDIDICMLDYLAQWLITNSITWVFPMTRQFTFEPSQYLSHFQNDHGAVSADTQQTEYCSIGSSTLHLPWTLYVCVEIFH
jgi:hypothetical protein